METSSLTQWVADNCAYAAGNLSIEQWIAENAVAMPVQADIKYDGMRVFFFKFSSKTVLVSKQGERYTKANYPALFDAIPKVFFEHEKLVLDCEFFKSEERIKVFDILYIHSRDLRSTPLKFRHETLQKLMSAVNPSSEYAWSLAESSLLNSIEEIEDYKEDAISRGYEGLVVKNLNSAYGKKNAWVKLKKFDTIDVFVTGSEPGHESTGGYAYHIATYDQSENIVNMGKVGSFRGKDIPDPSKIKFGDVLEVGYQEVTRDRHLRHPVAIRIRDDKLPSECIFELQVKRGGQNE